MSSDDTEEVPIVFLSEEDGDGEHLATPLRRRDRTRDILRAILKSGGVLVVVGSPIILFLSLLLFGWPYYSIPASERVFHPYHAVLRPSGSVGLLLGLLGTLLMVLNLGYFFRKRLLFVRWLGVLRRWMSIHVLTGILGPAVILFHSAFVPSSALGILSFSAMWIVVVTGIVGRYIYAHTPRSLEGRELEMDSIRKRLSGYLKQLRALGISTRSLGLEDLSVRRERSRGLTGAFLGLLVGDRANRREYRRLRDRVNASPQLKARAHGILPLLRTFCRERQWLVRFHDSRTLMASWRFFHRWLAVVMLLVLLFHIGLAVKFGDLWLFQGGE